MIGIVISTAMALASILPAPGIVHVEERLNEERANHQLAPFPLYFTPLGEPASIVEVVDGKKYRLTWTGTQAILEGEPDYPFVLEPKPGEVAVQQKKGGTWSLFKIKGEDLETWKSLMHGYTGWSHLPPAGGNGNGNGDHHDEQPFYPGDRVRIIPRPNYGIGTVVKVKKLETEMGLDWVVTARFKIGSKILQLSAGWDMFEKVFEGKSCEGNGKPEKGSDLEKLRKRLDPKVPKPLAILVTCAMFLFWWGMFDFLFWQGNVAYYVAMAGLILGFVGVTWLLFFRGKK